MNPSLTIEIFTAPVCNRCAGTAAMVQRVAADFAERTISCRVADVVEEIDYAVSLGVMATPAIVINGELVFASAPSEKAFRRAVHRLLEPNP